MKILPSGPLVRSLSAQKKTKIFAVGYNIFGCGTEGSCKQFEVMKLPGGALSRLNTSILFSSSEILPEINVSRALSRRASDSSMGTGQEGRTTVVLPALPQLCMNPLETGPGTAEGGECINKCIMQILPKELPSHCCGWCL